MYFSIKADIPEYTLSGRDLLSLKISEHNLSRNNVKNIRLFHIPGYNYLNPEITYDNIVFIPDSLWNRDFYTNFFDCMKSLLNKNGKIFICDKSTFIHRLLETGHGFNIITDKKERGFRSVVMKKR